MSRILITGGSSYLGRHLVPLAVEAGHTVHHTHHQNSPALPAHAHLLDIRDETAVRNLILSLQPDVVIHLIGSTASMAVAIRQGTGNVMWAARDVGARLIHLSTDAIFRGDAAPYDETAPPDPITPYGRAKADAESIVKQHSNHAIVRTSLIYGLEQMDHGTRWMSKALTKGDPVTLFSNQIRNPVWVNSLCTAVLELSHNPYRGILNIAGSQVLTRAQFALKMLDYWQVQPRNSLTIAPSDGRWPLNCELALTKATAVLKTSLPGVDELLTQIQK
ncbi:MAG: NAD(P)-dependent oxidoreductase [Ardenticatenaceae bacterium]|nr:MAG: NAD(P)-dependent oxidoreductase [Ardenticatenaceae bacterium]